MKDDPRPHLIVESNPRVDRLAAQVADRGQRAGLVGLDQTRVADDVGGHDRGQPPLRPSRRRHGSPPRRGATLAASPYVRRPSRRVFSLPAVPSTPTQHTRAVACAVAVQKGVAALQAEVPPERRIVFRIGVNLGDVVVEGEDLLGDGVNVAARLALRGWRGADLGHGP